MRAAVLTQPGQPLERWDDVAVRDPGPGEVLVALRASGVCHTDLHARGRRLPSELPMVLGHEGAGQILRTGPGVAGLRPGQHVILAWVPPCGECRFCLGGQAALCPVIREQRAGLASPLAGPNGPVAPFLGLGTFAEQAVVPVQAVVPIDDDVPFEVAALVGCGVMTGVGAVINTAKVVPGSTVAVIGCGGVGLNVVQGARLAGAATIVAIDRVQAKLDLARRFGATHAVTDTDLLAAGPGLTGGYGFDYTFEVIGHSATIRLAWDATRRGGTTVVVGAGSHSDLVEFSAGELFSASRRLLGCVYGAADVRTDFTRLLRLWRAGRLDLTGLVSRQIRLDQVNEAFDAIEAGTVVRSVIQF
jgi:S-(hydroxymethyl)glutathione dehydrogenase / alcohol dehydrogenase